MTLLDDIRSRRFLGLSFPLNATDRNSFKALMTLKQVETKIKSLRGETSLSNILHADNENCGQYKKQK